MSKLIKVAELACGHTGDIDRLDQLVQAALTTKCDAVKFQLFTVEERAEENTYEHELFSRHCLPFDAYSQVISKRIKDNDVAVYADIYGPSSLKHALSLNVSGIKIHAEDSDNYFLIEECFNSVNTLIISVGGLSLKSIIDLRDFLLELSRYHSTTKVVFVDGIQLFPTPRNGHSIRNLLNIREILADTPFVYGVADHIEPTDTYAHAYPLIAVSHGAQYLEKHLTIDRQDKWTDWQSAFQPLELQQLFDQAEETVHSFSIEQYPSYVLLSDKYKEMFKKYPVLSSRSNGKTEVSYKKLRDTNRTHIGGAFVHQNLDSLRKSDAALYGAPLSFSSFDSKVGAIVTVRSSSSRLPGKALLGIQGLPSVEVVLRRAQLIEGVDEVVVATSSDPSDDELAGRIEKMGYRVFRGQLDNLPSRMLACAIRFSFSHIVRITGDCVFLDYEGMSKALSSHLELSPDVTILSGGLFGTCKEVLSLEALHFLATRIISEKASEYFEYFMELPNLLKVSYIQPDYESSDIASLQRLTLDYPEDLETANLLYSGLQDGVLASCRKIAGFIDASEFSLPNSGLIQKNPLALGLNLAVDMRTLDPTGSRSLT